MAIVDRADIAPHGMADGRIFRPAAMQQNVELSAACLSLSGSRLDPTTSGFQATLKGPMIVPNFEGQLDKSGELSSPVVLKGL
jgi:hypothetical protein